MNIGWRQGNQKIATILLFIFKFLSQHVADIIMPITRRTSMCSAACCVLHLLCWLRLCVARRWAVCTVKVHMTLWNWKVHFQGAQCTVKLHNALWKSTVHSFRVPATHNHSQHNQCRTPHAAVHTLVLLMMGIIMSETCWDRSLIKNVRLVYILLVSLSSAVKLFALTYSIFRSMYVE